MWAKYCGRPPVRLRMMVRSEYEYQARTGLLRVRVSILPEQRKTESGGEAKKVGSAMGSGHPYMDGVPTAAEVTMRKTSGGRRAGGLRLGDLTHQIGRVWLQVANRTRGEMERALFVVHKRIASAE